MTREAKRVLFLAREAAAVRNSSEIGTSHLLIAIMKVHDPVTSELFARSGVSLDELQSELGTRKPERFTAPEIPMASKDEFALKRSVLSSTIVPRTHRREIPFSDNTRNAVRRAATESQQLSHSEVTPCHLTRQHVEVMVPEAHNTEAEGS